MCEFSAVALSDSDGSEHLADQNTSNGVTCHFALDCLCDLWGMLVEVDGDLSDGVIAGTDVPAMQW